MNIDEITKAATERHLAQATPPGPINRNAPLTGGANLEDTMIQQPQTVPEAAAIRAPGPLRSFNPDNIPKSLTANARWAPWKADFNEKRGKYDKIPHQCTAPYYGISTARPECWGTFDQALKAYNDNPSMFAGLGYVMTGPHDVVGIDLDNCVHDNVIADWARDVIAELDSYTELSPSGNGLRILINGAIPNDWTNHDVGIEVYAGHQPRFLTVTGRRLKQSGHDVTRPAQATLTNVYAQYAKSTTTTTATVISLAMPDLVDELLLPSIDSLPLPAVVVAFLTNGETNGDRSGALFASAVALYAAGLPDDQVFSILALNPFTKEVAMDHRHQDSDRALMYLWKEHCQKGKARVNVATADDFEDVSEASAAATEAIEKARRNPVLLDWSSMPDHPPEPKFVIPGWMPDGVVTLFAAHGGTGKSYLSLFIGLCLATGRHPFAMGIQIPRVKVLLYSAEDNMQIMQGRLAKYMHLMGVKPAELAGWLQVLDATECDNVLFSGDEKVNGRTTARFSWLAKQVKAFGAGVLIFDNASDAMDANENDRAKVRQFMSVLKRLASAVLLLAHVDAVSSMADPSEAKGYSGSTGWHNSARSRWFMTRVKDSDDISLTLPKVNYGKAGAEATIRWSDLHKVFEVVGTREGRARAEDHRGVLLGLVKHAIEVMGLTVSPASTSTGSVFNTVKDMDGCPHGLKTKDVAAEVKRWLGEGLAEVEEYRRANRSVGTRLVLTAAGRQSSDDGSEAGDLQ